MNTGPSQAGGLGALAPQFLAKQLTISQPGGQIIPTTVLPAPPPPDFQTLRRAWSIQYECIQLQNIFHQLSIIKAALPSSFFYGFIQKSHKSKSIVDKHLNLFENGFHLKISIEEYFVLLFSKMVPNF